jgi:hypothetical protein
MTVDAFGRQSMTISELKEQLDIMIEAGEGGKPVWVDAGDLFKPVRGIRVSDGNFILEVHHE